MAYARREFIDEVTGLPVREAKPGAVPSGRWVARVRPKKGAPLVTIEIDREELGPPTLQRADLSRSELVERAKVEANRQGEADAADARAAKRKGKQRVRGVGETFRTAGKAAAQFIEANHRFFDEAETRDLGDAVRDWMDAVEVRRGKAWRKLAKTKKGQEILGKFYAGRGGAFEALLTWLFSQARSKRWADVDWSLFELLEERIRSAPGGSDLPAVEYRPAAAIDAAALAVEQMTAAQAEEAARVYNAERLAELARELSNAYKASRKCLGSDERKVIRERARLVADLAKHPSRVWGLTLCVPEGTTRLCGLPVLEAELARVRRACDDGYDPDWPLREARRAAARGDVAELEQFPQGVQDMAEQRAKNPPSKARSKTPRKGGKRRSNPKTPDLAKVGAVAELGNVYDLIVENDRGEHVRYRWKGPRRQRPLLLWDRTQRMLFWSEGGNPSRLKKGAPRSDGAARVFENFAERDAQAHRTMALPRRKLARVGRAVFISYTEPWGRDPAKPLWEHDLAPSDVAYEAKGKGGSVFAVSGPRLTVTERGIVN